MQIDLMSCITEQLVPVAIDYRLQKDTFEITTVTQLEQVAGRMKERMTEKTATPTKLQQMRCDFWCCYLRLSRLIFTHLAFTCFVALNNCSYY